MNDVVFVIVVLVESDSDDVLRLRALVTVTPALIEIFGDDVSDTLVLFDIVGDMVVVPDVLVLSEVELDVVALNEADALCVAFVGVSACDFVGGATGVFVFEREF